MEFDLSEENLLQDRDSLLQFAEQFVANIQDFDFSSADNNQIENSVESSHRAFSETTSSDCDVLSSFELDFLEEPLNQASHTYSPVYSCDENAKNSGVVATH